LKEIELPPMTRVKQILESSRIPDVEEELARRLEGLPESSRPRRGQTVAVAAGSRGIAGFVPILRRLMIQLREWGANPFIFPAMGSHGGGTAEGQRTLLADYGVTEESVGAPIRSSMETVRVGELPDGTPVHCDRLAWCSDGIVLFNRVKPHSMFRGPWESGLLKMCAVGLGKHEGAAAFHRRKVETFHQAVPEIASAFLALGRVLFGVATVENGHDKVMALDVVPARDIMERERGLLVLARKSMARILLDEADILVVDELGKNISGDGMDPNVTGRSGTDIDFSENFKLETLVALDLTPQSHGNATGVGAADIITRRLAGKIDLASTYINHITSGYLSSAAIPLVANDDEEALRIACMCKGARRGGKRIVHIRNTSELEEIEVSLGMMREVDDSPDRFVPVSAPCPMAFADGRLRRV
jgi:hypothetical protein